MPQTFYIENDEEIISVIGRLRHSSGEENYFIFPKRSLVLQSIINLKLLQREAEKLGKQVVVVTQDEAGMALAEKVGLATERYTDDFSRKSAHLELVSSSEVKPVSLGEERIQMESPKSEDLGSSEFYIAPKMMSAPVATPASGRLLRVRNVTPPKQTSLNSKQMLPEAAQKSLPIQAPLQPYPRASIAPASTARPQPLPSAAPLTQTMPPLPSTVPSQNAREARLKNFYTNEKVANLPIEKMVKPPKQASPQAVTHTSRGHWILFFLGGISLLSLIGVGVFVFLPRAEVHVVPYKMTQNVDLQFDGQLEGVLTDDTIIPVRIIEKEQEIIISADATGVSSGTAQKSRGTVVIYNSFSAEAQSLVATTRLESPEGKIFRLSEGVTVPGMNGTAPGATEAQVIADQPGAEYNISATTFTIPGFKGSQKFEKFRAKSNAVMAGGSQATSADFRVISKGDLDTVEALAKEKAKEAFQEAVQKTLTPGERILEENLEITPTANASLPIAGTVATSFEYKNTFSVRGFIFSESAIKDIIRAKGEETTNGVLFRPVTLTLSYKEAVPNYEEKKVRLKVHAIIDSESVIDTEELVNAILGKDGDGVNEALTRLPAIKKMDIIFKPQWFTSVVPASKSRVTVVVEPGSAD